MRKETSSFKQRCVQRKGQKRIAESVLPDLNAGCCCRLFAGILQIVFRIFAGYMQLICLSAVTGQFPIHILAFSTFFMQFPHTKKNRGTHRWTKQRSNGPSNGQMDRSSYRDAWTHLKRSTSSGGSRGR